MGKIIIRLPSDRQNYGAIHVEDNNGNVVAGPYPALGASDTGRAEAEGNQTRDPLYPYGDTPTGAYEGGEVIASGQGTGFNSKAYGDSGVIRLTPASGQAKDAANNGRDGLLIHGGELNNRGGLRPTYGCIRVNNDDMADLVEAYTNIGAIEDNMCTIDGDVTKIDFGPETPGAPGIDPLITDPGGDPPPGFSTNDDFDS